MDRRTMIAGAAALAAPVGTLVLADPIFAAIDRERQAHKDYLAAIKAVDEAEQQLPHDFIPDGYRIAFYGDDFFATTEQQVRDFAAGLRSSPDDMSYRDLEAVLLRRVNDWQQNLKRYDELNIPALQEAEQDAGDRHTEVERALFATTPTTPAGMVALIDRLSKDATKFTAAPCIEAGLAALKEAAATLLKSSLLKTA